MGVDWLGDRKACLALKGQKHARLSPCGCYTTPHPEPIHRAPPSAGHLKMRLRSADSSSIGMASGRMYLNTTFTSAGWAGRYPQLARIMPASVATSAPDSSLPRRVLRWCVRGWGGVGGGWRVQEVITWRVTGPLPQTATHTRHHHYGTQANASTHLRPHPKSPRADQTRPHAPGTCSWQQLWQYE